MIFAAENERVEHYILYILILGFTKETFFKGGILYILSPHNLDELYFLQELWSL